jgi:hypothetical protein
MNRLIFLTTAITRGKFHNDTIGNFYKQHYKNLKQYEVYHIINIDHPDKLKNTYNRNDTVDYFNEMIPKEVKKEFILTDEPGFAKAYLNVLGKIHELEIMTDKTIVWWLEDDWYLIKKYNILPLLNLLNINNCALSLTNNAPLCSFRAGPIMNLGFFDNVFDLHLRVGKDIDPEYKVGKFLRMNRVVEKYDDIFIICIYIESLFSGNITFNEACPWYYNKKMRGLKFNPGKKLKRLVCLLENPESTEVCYKEVANNLSPTSMADFKQISTLITLNKFHEVLKNASINYITIVPHMFKDAGRFFNKQHGLIKNGITYS